MAAIELPRSSKQGGPRFHDRGRSYRSNRPSSNVRVRQNLINKQRPVVRSDTNTTTSPNTFTSNRNVPGQITKRSTQYQVPEMVPPSLVRHGGTREQDSDDNLEANRNVIYQGVVRELGVIKGRVNKVLEDFDTTCLTVEDIPSDFTEESQLTVNKVMEEYNNAHSREKEMTLEQINLLSEDNPKDDQTMLKDLEEMSDEEFMNAYHLTRNDLRKLKSINVGMLDMASEMRSFAEQAAIKTMTFSHGSNSLEKARYEKMFSMFTDESVKSIKMTSELANHRKDVVKLREENDALLEQSTREEERADQSTKKLLKAEKELRGLHREVEYLTILLKQSKGEEDSAKIVPMVYYPEGHSSELPDLSSVHPSPTDPRAGYKLSAAEMMVEIEEARKLSPEFQIKRLERLLQRTAFIDKEPMNNTKSPSENVDQNGDPSPSVGNENPKNKPNKRKKRKDHPLPFQKVIARKVTNPVAARTHMPCNVTAPQIQFFNPTSIQSVKPRKHQETFLGNQTIQLDNTEPLNVHLDNIDTPKVRREKRDTQKVGRKKTDKPLFKVVMPTWVRRMRQRATQSAGSSAVERKADQNSLSRNKSRESHNLPRPSTADPPRNVLHKEVEKWRSASSLGPDYHDDYECKLPRIPCVMPENHITFNVGKHQRQSQTLVPHPLGQYPSYNSDAVRGAAQFSHNTLPRMAYTVRNFRSTHRVDVGEVSSYDHDDEFSRVPAETLYKAILGTDMYKSLYSSK